MPSYSTLLLTTLFALVAAKQNFDGCVYTSLSSDRPLVYYVPETGEICDNPDCGGGRAPPKTTVPGCAAYKGTASYSASFLPNYTPAAATTTSSTTIADPTSASAPGTTIADPTSAFPTDSIYMPGTTSQTYSRDLATEVSGLSSLTSATAWQNSTMATTRGTATPAPTGASSSVSAGGAMGSFGGRSNGVLGGVLGALLGLVAVL